MGNFDTVLLDIDGTLVDSNYHHVVAWQRAFFTCDIDIPAWLIHRAIGMGGDKLVAHVASERVERSHGDTLRAAWAREFKPLRHEVREIRGAHDLIATLKDNGLKVVLASSGSADDVNYYLDLLDARALVDHYTTADDVSTSKPSPDLLSVALDTVGGARGLMIGDSPWDVLAATQLKIPAYGVLSGGFGRDELTESGAAAIYSSVADLDAIAVAKAPTWAWPPTHH